MAICHSFIVAYRWDGFFENLFFGGFWIAYALVVLFATLAVILDGGAWSWSLLLAFITTLILFALIQYETAQGLASVVTGHHGLWCHSDNLTGEMPTILPDANTRTFYLQFLPNASLVALAFWIPFIAIRKLKRAPNR